MQTNKYNNMCVGLVVSDWGKSVVHLYMTVKMTTFYNFIANQLILSPPVSALKDVPCFNTLTVYKVPFKRG